MSKIYQLIETQINSLLQFILQDAHTGEIQFNQWIRGPALFRSIVQFISIVVFIILALMFGVYLWNFGIVPVLPGLAAPITSADPAQAANPYVQLIVSLIALMMFT